MTNNTSNNTITTIITNNTNKGDNTMTNNTSIPSSTLISSSTPISSFTYKHHPISNIPSHNFHLTTSSSSPIFSFDLDDTIIPTSQFIHNLTIKYFSHLLPHNHTHPNNDPYQTLKDLHSSNKINQAQLQAIFSLASILAISYPFPHIIKFINSLPQKHINIVTSRNSFYNPNYIIKTLQPFFPNKTFHLHNPNTHSDNSSSTDFIASNATKHEILFSLNKEYNVTHFVDDLPFLHSKLLNSPVTLTLHIQPWTSTFVHKNLNLTYDNFDILKAA
jgi:hypothetical protein